MTAKFVKVRSHSGVEVDEQVNVVFHSVDSAQKAVLVLYGFPYIAIQVVAVIVANGRMTVSGVDDNMEKCINSAHSLLFRKVTSYFCVKQVLSSGRCFRP